MLKKLLSLFLLLLGGCSSIPEGIKPVENFDLKRYLGKWYEIARFDHRFERGLQQVTAEYSLREDGRVRVLNRGYSEPRAQWRQAEAIAKFADDPHTAHLRVSFFRPFYASYIVFELDHEGYQYALVTSSTRSYLWILAREPVLEDELLSSLLQTAREQGFDTDKLIFVDHKADADTG